MVRVRFSNLHKRLAAEKGSKRLEEAFENKEVLTAKVSQVLDGGLCVVVDETRVFIPASLVSDTYEKGSFQIQRSGDRVRDQRVQSKDAEESSVTENSY